jgi:hypothetical protein
LVALKLKTRFVAYAQQCLFGATCAGDTTALHMAEAATLIAPSAANFRMRNNSN